MTNKPNLLCIDDDERILRSLKTLFKHTHNVYTTTSPDEFKQLILNEKINVIISDQRMPEDKGTDLLQFAKEFRPSAIRILLTGYTDNDAIIDAINKGEVYRYISKPWDIEELQMIVKHATEIAIQADVIPITEASTKTEEKINDDKKRLSIVYADKYKMTSQLIARELSNKHDLTCTASMSDLKNTIEENEYDIAIVDMNFKEEEIKSFLHYIKTKKPFFPIILLAHKEEADILVSLINSRKIDRVSQKPISSEVLEKNILQTIEAYEEIRKSPELKLRHLNEYLNDSLTIEQIIDVAELIEELKPKNK